MVPLPVALIEDAPGPKYSTILLVPPFTVSRPRRCVITSLAEVHPASLPVRRTPMRPGSSTSHASPAMASPQSAPPTPMATMPRPPQLGVCESAPIMSPPGKA